jgi:hypothetical protein
MTNSRLPVPAPAKATLGYGLFSVAENRSDPPALRGHWKSGIEWQNVCPDADATYDQCVSNNALNISSLPTADPKVATASRSQWGATPFTVLVEIDCSAPGFWENAEAIIGDTFTEAEQDEVARVFWTGTSGAPNIAFPHLASSSTLEDGNTVLQLATANVGPTGSTVLDIVEALGKIEQALSACVKGVGTIHVPAELVAHLAANHLLDDERDGVLYSPAGHKISVSAGYPGTAPDGSAVAGVKWIYATGPVFLYRSKAGLVGDRKESLDRSVNMLKMIFERTYVIGYDCCLFGVAVSTGGVLTGTASSAA